MPPPLIRPAAGRYCVPLLSRLEALGGVHRRHRPEVDATGATLLPGLIDSHVHTSAAGLGLALRFGVTTELEMQGTLHYR